MGGIRLRTLADSQKVGHLMTKVVDKQCRKSGINPLFCNK